MTGVFKNNRRTPVKDTLTGQVYRSKYQAGKVPASRFGLDSEDKFVWYKILKRVRPGRFVELQTGKSERLRPTTGRNLL